MCFLAQFVSPKHGKTKAQKGKSKPVFPGLGILFDIPKRAEGREYPMYVAWKQFGSAGEVGNSKGRPLLELFHYTAQLGHRCSWFHNHPRSRRMFITCPIDAVNR